LVDHEWKWQRRRRRSKAFVLISIIEMVVHLVDHVVPMVRLGGNGSFRSASHKQQFVQWEEQYATAEK
jgi:hypothetical protein